MMSETPPVSALALEFTAQADDIDQFGHVNNAVWVRWIQEVARTHWERAAPTEQQERLAWLVVRHEIDYLRPLHEGETAVARTWIDPEVRGARSTRHVIFERDGKTLVRAATGWAMIDLATGRAQRVRPEHLAPFLPSDD
ncbi:thioesterase family protein [Sphingomicrobium sp. XHP0239]|uniref:acyl-CoA thioesterase n=1 Tax=Sphingomicrobium maritimum TaxID=3133972 RepID=UPI0031CC38AD